MNLLIICGCNFGCEYFLVGVRRYQNRVVYLLIFFFFYSLSASVNERDFHSREMWTRLDMMFFFILLSSFNFVCRAVSTISAEISLILFLNFFDALTRFKGCKQLKCSVKRDRVMCVCCDFGLFDMKCMHTVTRSSVTQKNVCVFWVHDQRKRQERSGKMNSNFLLKI